MAFKELCLLYNKIITTGHQTFGNGDFACQEMENYNNAISSFLKAGRIYYDQENLTTEQLYRLFETDLKSCGKWEEFFSNQTDEEDKLSIGVR